MISARNEILGRVRAGLADVPGSETPDAVPVSRGYRRAHHLGGLVDLFGQ